MALLPTSSPTVAHPPPQRGLALLRSACPLPLCCPLALVARAFGSAPPAWAWSPPRAASEPLRDLVGLFPLAGQQYRGGSLAAFEAGLWQLAGATEDVGPPPPGGFAAWPQAAVALPFFAGTAAYARAMAHPGGRAVPWRGPAGADPSALGGWRAFALTFGVFATPAGLALTAVWLGRLPPGRNPQAARARLLAARDRLFARCQAAAGAVVACQPPAPSRRPQPAPASAAGRAAFMGRVEAARAAIGRGSLAKVVLARSQRRALGGGTKAPSPLATLHALRATYPQAHRFLWQVQGGAYFVGASPERLLALAGRCATTHAVAGTAIDAAAGARLLRSKKDLAEHRFVVAALAASLRPLSQRLQVPKRPRLLPAGRLLHLETPIAVTLAPGVTGLMLASALHPTPALAGTPVAAAAAYLAEQEPWRGLYGGLIGPWSPTTLTLAVSIRSALLTTAGAFCFAGAGIVWQSDAASEWLETAAKLETIGAALR